MSAAIGRLLPSPGRLWRTFAPKQANFCRALARSDTFRQTHSADICQSRLNLVNLGPTLATFGQLGPTLAHAAGRAPMAPTPRLLDERPGSIRLALLRWRLRERARRCASRRKRRTCAASRVLDATLDVDADARRGSAGHMTFALDANLAQIGPSWIKHEPRSVELAQVWGRS